MFFRLRYVCKIERKLCFVQNVDKASCSSSLYYFQCIFQVVFISFLLDFDVVFVFIGFYSYISFYWFCNCIRFYFHFFSYYFVS